MGLPEYEHMPMKSDIADRLGNAVGHPPMIVITPTQIMRRIANITILIIRSVVMITMTIPAIRTIITMLFQLQHNINQNNLSNYWFLAFSQG